MNKKTYLFIIALLSVALCVSVTFNLSGKTEASAAAPVKKAKVSKKVAKLSSEIIDDINSEFNGTFFQVVSYDSGRLTLNFRRDVGGGLYDNKILYVDNVDVDNDVSYE